jgi:hypothetical protein
MSVVLVIIGLIVGGILVGQSLINAAAVRAEVSQIEKYNQAVNTFYGKYGYLPGDIPDPAASSFGFLARGQNRGEGDGNGTIEGVHTDGPNDYGPYEQGGETCMVWADLSAVQLIEDSFTICSPTSATHGSFSLQNLNQFLPLAKIGRGNYIYAYSWASGALSGLGNVWGISAGLPGYAGSTTGLTVAEAYQIDTKVDDGLPQSGRVIAIYIQNPTTPWFAGTNTGSESRQQPPAPPLPASTTVTSRARRSNIRWSKAAATVSTARSVSRCRAGDDDT